MAFLSMVTEDHSVKLVKLLGFHSDLIPILINQEAKMNLLHVESRTSKSNANKYEFLMECDSTRGNVPKALNLIRDKSCHFYVTSRDINNVAQGKIIAESLLVFFCFP